MSFYKKYQDEITTMQLLSQILGKMKLNYAAQEPQWAYVILDITTRGFSTGLLKVNHQPFEMEINLLKDFISLETREAIAYVDLVDGKSISEYYAEIVKKAESLGIPMNIQTIPQEMSIKTPFEEDQEHHHYNQDFAMEMLKWFQLAWDVEQQFIAPIRQRKVYPGLFWGTFDVACILLYNQFESFVDDEKVISRAAFDEQMVEFGFWLGDDNFDYPTFFTLPYPFVEDKKLPIDESFPKGSYFSPKMAEYLLEIKEPIDEVNREEIIQFIEASCKKSLEYLEWENTHHYFEDLKMDRNKK